MPNEDLVILGLKCCLSDKFLCLECPYTYSKHMNGIEFELMPNGKCYDEFSCDEWLKIDLLSLIERLSPEL